MSKPLLGHCFVYFSNSNSIFLHFTNITTVSLCWVLSALYCGCCCSCLAFHVDVVLWLLQWWQCWCYYCVCMACSSSACCSFCRSCCWCSWAFCLAYCSCCSWLSLTFRGKKLRGWRNKWNDWSLLYIFVMLGHDSKSLSCKCCTPMQ